MTIISDRGAQFTAQFLKSFLKGLGSNVNLSTAFNSQTNGQKEYIINTLEDMLRSCVINFNGRWDDYLPLLEFHTTIDTIQPSKRLYMNLFMGEDVNILLGCSRLV